MKKYLVILLLLTAAIIMAGCSRESVIVPPAGQGVSFDVSLEDVTKAAIDDDGHAASVNRCILQIWQGDQIYSTVVKTAPAGTKEYHFKGVILDPEQTYDFLFWADCGTSEGQDRYYSTQSLRNVSLQNPHIGNDDALDAFCGRKLGCRIDDKHQTLVLRRPLAQVNVITGDLPSMSRASIPDEFRPLTVSYSYYGCTSFDVFADTYAAEPELITVTDVPVYGETMKSGQPAANCTLAMNYLFPQGGESVSSVSLTVNNINGTTINWDFQNIPFKRNCRTNIRGNILTVNGNFSIVVDPIFSGSIDYIN